MTKQSTIKKRLEYLRKELRAERISYAGLNELQGLAPHIDRSDVELLEAAGVLEFPDDCDHVETRCTECYQKVRPTI